MTEKQVDNADDRARERGIYKVTVVGSVVNLLLLLFKFATGIMAQSAAMLADAVHSLSDFITDVIVFVFVHISTKPEDEGHDYGHGKYETMATLSIGVILFIVGLGILWNGATTIWDVWANDRQLNEPGILALVAALISIVSKEALYQYTILYGRKLNSQAVVANAWHHRSDALSSIGTAVGIGGAIMLGPDWRILDPLAAIIVSFFIMKVAIQLFSPCMGELLEKSLPKEIENQITNVILSFDGVNEPHHLRTRRIGNHYAIEVHIRMNGNITLHEAHATATAIEHRLKQLYGEHTHIGIHVEPVK